MPRWHIIPLVIAALLLDGCDRLFPPNLHLSRQVSSQEIVGTWLLASHTMELAKNDGYAPPVGSTHEIVFRADGTCQFSSITEFGHKVDFLDAAGTWKLEHDTGIPSQKKRKNEVSIRIKDRGISLYLIEERGHLLLWDFWGDPDEWTLLRYEKKG